MRGIFVILSVAVIAFVFTTQTVAYEDADCYDEGLKLTIKRGETVYPKDECLRMYCTDEGKIHPEPCEMGIPPNCNYVDGDMTKEWPACCPSYKCEDDED